MSGPKHIESLAQTIESLKSRLDEEDSGDIKTEAEMLNAFEGQLCSDA